MALQLLSELRPGLRIVLFGTHHRVRAPFAFEQLGVESTERLRRLYSEATVGLSLSLTNYSLIPNEMIACGLPVVELAAGRARACTATDGSLISLADADPRDIAHKLAGLLDDDALRERTLPRRAGLRAQSHVGGAADADRTGAARGPAVAAPGPQRRPQLRPPPGIGTFRDARRLEHPRGRLVARRRIASLLGPLARFRRYQAAALRASRSAAHNEQPMTRLLHPLTFLVAIAALAAPARSRSRTRGP